MLTHYHQRFQIGQKKRENSITSLQERLLNGPIAAVGAAVNSDEILTALNSNHRFIFADGSIGIIQEFENEIRENMVKDVGISYRC